jgi:hypothetical protein
MIIENNELLWTCGALGAASLLSRLVLYRREMALKNAYGLIKFETFAGLLAHRAAKALTGIMVVICLVAGGAFYLLGYQVTVEDSFAKKALIAGIAVLGVGALGIAYGLLRKGNGTSAQA